MELTLFDLVRVFNQISLSSLGGATSAWAYRIMVKQRQWMTDDEFLSARAMSQILPGPNMLNLAVYVGAQFRGWLGALAAVFGLVAIPFLLVMSLGIWYFHSGYVPSVQSVLSGLAAAAVGVSFGAAFDMSRSRLRDPFFLLVTAAVFIMVGVYRLPMIPVALGTTALSLVIYRPRIKVP